MLQKLFYKMVKISQNYSQIYSWSASFNF